jgi:hypothetical protein
MSLRFAGVMPAGDLHESMNESVEQKDYVTMQIVCCLYREFSTNLFQEINMLITLVRTF